MTGITLFYKRFLDLSKKERDKMREDFKTDIKKQIREEFDTKFKENTERDMMLEGTLTRIDKRLDTITAGLLSVQRGSFENHCKKLLEIEHTITVDEYQQITNDHEIYNSLGGNHNGDQLFALVEQKMKSHLER